jgi:hypothetical protein
MRKKIRFVLVIMSCFFISEGFSQQILSLKSLKPENLKPAILYWDFGNPEYLTIETIYPFRDSVSSYWNVTHRSPVLDDTTGNGFDYYLINEKGLKTVKSHMYHTGFTNYLINFQNDSAHLSIRNPQDTIEYKIKLPEFVAPEGPGTAVFLGSLPLSIGYHIEYYELNRWIGLAPNTGQVVLTELKVVGVDKLEIDGKEYDTFKINITTKNGRFTEIWALKDNPHYWVKVNHKIDSQRIMRSKVVKILIFG